MVVTRARSAIFPLPLFAAPHKPHGSSRATHTRYHHSLVNTDLANNCVLSLNQLSASFGSAAVPLPSSISVNHNNKNSLAGNSFESPSVTPIQSRLLSHVYRCATRFGSHRGSSEPMSGADLDPLFDLKFLSEHLRNADLLSYINKPTASVVPIIADRISLPTARGAVDLLHLLPKHLQNLYSSDTENLLRSPSDRPPAPRSRLCASKSEWVKLVRRLMAAGMVEFTTQPKVVCGVFAVPKDDATDRLIIDARPANAVFAEPAAVKLPTPDLLAKLSCDPKRHLFVAKVDLDNFYHRLKLPVSLRPYFALPPVRACDVGLGSEFGSDTLVHPCCVTLPMGWSHSVLLAQAAHEEFLTTRTDLQVRDRITLDTDGRCDRVRHQVYIDDLILFGHDEAEVRRRQDSYVEAITSLGLVVKPSKIVRPSRLGVECLGLVVNGTSHTVGVSVPKIETLCGDTRRLMVAGQCTGDDLAHIIGRWSWALLACRAAFAVFNAVYRFIECAGRKLFRVWDSVKRELSTIIGLAPLLFTDITDQWCDRLVAVDASSQGLGVVATPVAEHSPASVATTDDATRLVTSGVAWSTIVSSRWKQPEHINVLELRALCTAVRWMLSRRRTGHKMFVLSDSQVVVGAVNKGRSSSQLLLRRLRHLSSLVLASGFRISLHWIRSADNPADGPSRR